MFHFFFDFKEIKEEVTHAEETLQGEEEEKKEIFSQTTSFLVLCSVFHPNFPF